MSNYTLQIALIMIVIIADYVTGIVKACYHHDYKSCVMREGLYHKVAELMAVAVMYFIELGLPMIGVTINFPFISFITFYVIFMELSSIVENIGEINPSLVGPLSEVFEKVKEAKEFKVNKDD